MSGGKACVKQAAQYTGKASASCPASERMKARTSLASTTKQLSELDKETPSLSYVQDETLGKVSLNLKVKGRDGFVHYKIKKTQALKKLMKDYCIRKGLEMNTICFLFDGNRLSETQTPAELNMEGDDMIEVRKLLAAGAFAAALEAIPNEDWCRTWAAGRTIMLRRTSKRVKEVMDKMRLPAVVRLSRSFWVDARNEFVLRQLTLMTAWCRISTLELLWN
jgi:small ubiquitin-related modifier